MDGEGIFEAIVLMLCGFGCGALFSWIGSWAKTRKDPMPFWTGSVVDPKTITDIQAYNLANARMWKQYALPYWLTGICGFTSFLDARISIVVGCWSVGLASTVGIVWLICSYKKIEKQYKA